MSRPIHFEIQADDLRHTRDTVLGLIAEHTGQTYEKVSKDTERDYFMSAEEAKDYGIVDRVIESH